jgi:hypothetical protein
MVGWFSASASALLTAVAGTLLSGYLADLSVRWYRVASFEGSSAHYVIGRALGGGVAAFAVGIIVARIFAGHPNPGVPKSRVLSWLAVGCMVGMSTESVNQNVPPFGSPSNGTTFARFASGDGGAAPPLTLLTDVVQNRAYTVPIDATRMRWAALDDPTPAWFAHHLKWQHEFDGVDTMVARAHVDGIPYHAARSIDDLGVLRLRFSSGGDKLRAAIVEMPGITFRVEHGELTRGTYDYIVAVDGVPGRIGTPGEDGDAKVVSARAMPDNAPPYRIANLVDTNFATGMYDAAFTR